MIARSFLALFASLLLIGCSSSPPLMRLDVQATPTGSRVFLSLQGELAYTGKLGPIQGDVKSESFEEDFVLLGTAPLTYALPLRETESDATVLGFGGKVVRKYKEGILRFEKPGFQTVERRIRFHEGETTITVEMPAEHVAPRP